jgi:CheY-like chemotaxis protein
VPGPSVLVVEDEPMVMLLLQDMLEEIGCEVIATAARLEPALRLAREAAFDVALLDVNIGGARIDPVADAVVARGLPVIFLTGYGADAVGRKGLGPVLEKPYRRAELERAIARCIPLAKKP